MPLVTFNDLYNLMLDIRKEIKDLKQANGETNLELISLNKAAKQFHKSPEFLKQEIRAGRLKAIFDKNNKRKRIQFRIKDLEEWQSNQANGKDIEPEENLTDFARRYTEDFHARRNRGKKNAKNLFKHSNN